MTCKIAPLIFIFIIIMFLSNSKNIIGGNFIEDLGENPFSKKKFVCSKDPNIMKLGYNKNSCIFVDIYNNYTKKRLIEFLKKQYTNIYDNISDNTVNIYCKLYMPLSIVIDDKSLSEELLDNLLKLLTSINQNFIILDYFKLHKIYLNDKDKWYKIYKKHIQIYKKFSKNSYKIAIKNFLIASINPIHSTIYNRLYYFIDKKKNNDKKIIDKITDENKKNIVKNKSFSEFYRINSREIKDNNLLFDNFDDIKDNKEINFGSIINHLILILDYIYKNDLDNINLFAQNLLIFKEVLNNEKYNLLFTLFNKELINHQYIYNKICINSYFKNSILSCPSKISVNFDSNKEIYNCYDYEDNKSFKNIYSKNDKCNSCVYSIKDCKINLKCNDEKYINDDNYLNIDPHKKYTNIIQNKCMLNTSVVNIIDENPEDEIKKQKIANYNKKLLSFSKPLCIKTYESLNTINVQFSFLNHLSTYFIDNNIYNYFYINKKLLDYISDRYRYRITDSDSLFNKNNKSIGYITINKDQGPGASRKVIMINYLFNPNHKFTTQKEKYHLTDDNKRLIKNSLENKQSEKSIEDLKKIVINIGKKGIGGRYNSSTDINTCPTKGGNTIISFKIKDRKNYGWYFDNSKNISIIAYGGNINNKMNIAMKKNNLVKAYSENGKSSLHKFYNKYNVCAGSGGGTIHQSEEEIKLTTSNRIEEKGNKFNKKELFTIRGKKYYLYQKNDKNKSYHITSNKDEIISYPSGGKGGSIRNFDGQNSQSFGCGGGSGAKEIYETKKKFGQGGDGKEGAVIIMDQNGNILFNSTSCPQSIINNEITINIKTKIDRVVADPSCPPDDKTNSISINLYNNEYFYIISIGAGAGGEISGYGGNAGNIIISKHCNFNIDSSIITDSIQQDYKAQLIINEKSFKNNIYNIIYNAVNNLYTGLNYNYEMIRNNFINIDKDKETIIDQTKYNNVDNIACLYNTCLAKINVERNTELVHKLYSINSNKNSTLFKYVKFTKESTPAVPNFSFKITLISLTNVESEIVEQNVLSYYVNKNLILYKKNPPSEANKDFFKENQKIKKLHFPKITDRLWFLVHNFETIPNFYFITKSIKYDTTNTQNLWINNDSIIISSIDKNNESFQCKTNIKPTGNDIICSIRLPDKKIKELLAITDLTETEENKKCSFIYNQNLNRDQITDYCGSEKKRLNKLFNGIECNTPDCARNIDADTCCEIIPQKCQSIPVEKKDTFCPSTMRLKNSLGDSNICETDVCDKDNEKDVLQCCEYIPNKCNSLDDQTEIGKAENEYFFKNHPHREYNRKNANKECTVKNYTNRCNPKILEDLMTCSIKRPYQKCGNEIVGTLAEKDQFCKISDDYNINHKNREYDTDAAGVECGKGLNQKDNWKCNLKDKESHREQCCKYIIPKCNFSRENGGPDIDIKVTDTNEEIKTKRDNWCGHGFIWDDAKNDVVFEEYYDLDSSFPRHTDSNRDQIKEKCCKINYGKCSNIPKKEAFCATKDIEFYKKAISTDKLEADNITKYTYDIDNNQQECTSTIDCNPNEDKDFYNCCKVPAQMKNDRDNEASRISTVLNVAPDHIKSSNEDKALKELVKCKNYRKCYFYRGLNYTADAIYKNINIVRLRAYSDKYAASPNDINIFTLPKQFPLLKKDDFDIYSQKNAGLPYIYKNPNKVSSNELQFTFFKELKNKDVKFENNDLESANEASLSYKINYTKHNIYTPYIFSFDPKYFMIDFKEKLYKNNLPATAIHVDEINYPEEITNTITIKGKLNRNIKIGMGVYILVKNESSDSEYIYNSNKVYSDIDDYEKDFPKIKINNNTVSGINQTSKYNFYKKYTYLESYREETELGLTTLTFGCREMETESLPTNNIIDYTDTYKNKSIYSTDNTTGKFIIKEISNGWNETENKFLNLSLSDTNIILKFGYFGVPYSEYITPTSVTTTSNIINKMYFYHNNYYLQDDRFIWQVQHEKKNKWKSVPYKFCCSHCETNYNNNNTNNNNNVYSSTGTVDELYELNSLESNKFKKYEGWGRKNHNNLCFGKILQKNSASPQNLYEPLQKQTLRGGSQSSCGSISNPLALADCEFKEDLKSDTTRARCDNIKINSDSQLPLNNIKKFCYDANRNDKSSLTKTDLCESYECTSQDKDRCCDGEVRDRCFVLSGRKELFEAEDTFTEGTFGEANFTPTEYANWANFCNAKDDGLNLVPKESAFKEKCYNNNCSETKSFTDNTDLNNRILCCTTESLSGGSSRTTKCKDQPIDEDKLLDKDKDKENVNSDMNDDNCFIQVPTCKDFDCEAKRIYKENNTDKNNEFQPTKEDKNNKILKKEQEIINFCCRNKTCDDISKKVCKADEGLSLNPEMKHRSLNETYYDNANKLIKNKAIKYCCSRSNCKNLSDRIHKKIYPKIKDRDYRLKKYCSKFSKNTRIYNKEYLKTTSKKQVFDTSDDDKLYNEYQTARECCNNKDENISCNVPEIKKKIIEKYGKNSKIIANPGKFQVYNNNGRDEQATLKSCAGIECKSVKNNSYKYKENISFNTIYPGTIEEGAINHCVLKKSDKKCFSKTDVYCTDTESVNGMAIIDPTKNQNSIDDGCCNLANTDMCEDRYISILTILSRDISDLLQVAEDNTVLRELALDATYKGGRRGMRPPTVGLSASRGAALAARNASINASISPTPAAGCRGRRCFLPTCVSRGFKIFNPVTGRSESPTYPPDTVFCDSLPKYNCSRVDNKDWPENTGKTNPLTWFIAPRNYLSVKDPSTCFTQASCTLDSNSNRNVPSQGAQMQINRGFDLELKPANERTTPKRSSRCPATGTSCHRKPQPDFMSCLRKQPGPKCSELTDFNDAQNKIHWHSRFRSYMESNAGNYLSNAEYAEKRDPHNTQNLSCASLNDCSPCWKPKKGKLCSEVKVSDYTIDKKDKKEYKYITEKFGVGLRGSKIGQFYNRPDSIENCFTTMACTDGRVLNPAREYFKRRLEGKCEGFTKCNNCFEFKKPRKEIYDTEDKRNMIKENMPSHPKGAEIWAKINRTKKYKITEIGRLANEPRSIIKEKELWSIVSYDINWVIDNPPKYIVNTTPDSEAKPTYYFVYDKTDFKNAQEAQKLIYDISHEAEDMPKILDEFNKILDYDDILKIRNIYTYNIRLNKYSKCYKLPPKTRGGEIIYNTENNILENKYDNVDVNNIPEESNLNYNILNGNNMINYANIRENKIKGGASESPKLDIKKNQIVICLKDMVKEEEGIYTYNASIYQNNKKINILDIKDRIEINNTNNIDGPNTYILKEICKYFSVGDKLEITNIYESRSDDTYEIKEKISINYNNIYVISFYKILNDYNLHNIDNSLIKTKYIDLTKKYNKSSYEFYFIFNSTTSETSILRKNYTYSLRAVNEEGAEIKIKCIDNVDIYDIILINKEKKPDFEITDTYKLILNRKKECKVASDLFNIKEDSSGNNLVCCNIPVLDDKLNSMCSIENSMCWHQEKLQECKINYFKILDVIGDKVYFNIGKLPTIGDSPIELKVDIYRNNNIMKKNIRVKIKKDKDDLNIENILKEKSFWFIGDPDIIKYIFKNKYPIINNDLKLFGNDIIIEEQDLSQLDSTAKANTSLLYFRTKPYEIKNDSMSSKDYIFTIKFNNKVKIEELYIFASYSTMASYDEIYNNFIIETNNFQIKPLIGNNKLYKPVSSTNELQNWKKYRESYKFQLFKSTDKKNIESYNITIKFIIPKTTTLNLYNFSIKGKQTNFNSNQGFGEGQIELLESNLNLMKNDTIILKKNIKKI